MGIPEFLRQRLVPLRDQLDGVSGWKPVRTENFHLTLKFLGDVSGGTLEDLDAELQRKLPTPGPINLVLRGVGAFPDPRSPRVVWAGIQPSAPLRGIHEFLESIGLEHGIEEDDHEFHPHVTLGRIKGGSPEGRRLLDWIQEHGEKQIGEFESGSITLYESELTPDGPQYSRRAEWPL